ncbi:MAG: hypothetical protein J6Y37_15290 [Paludibacteraceae bacterium]|nr:hypothetical protein [Paludibacteraceae bacterium]
MKKVFLSLMFLWSLLLADATPYMYVKTVDGKIETFDAEKVSEVYYEKVEEAKEVDGVTVSGNVCGYTYVDLGLSVKWATYNVGATTHLEVGDYFAWGETQPKDSCDMSTYKWYDSVSENITKYCDADGKTVLEAEDDAATVKWGNDWRMPTEAERQELEESCDWTWTYNFNGAGVAGIKGVSKINGNVIFLPAGGYVYKYGSTSIGTHGEYWSSSLEDSKYAYMFYFTYDQITWFGLNRADGRNIRPVSSSVATLDDSSDAITNMCVKTIDGKVVVFDVEKVVKVYYDMYSWPTVSGEIGGHPYVDLGSSCGKWATYNVGATKTTEYGDYFAWGEIEPKDIYTNDNYKWGEYHMTKYCEDSEEGELDYKTTLEAEDDAATANWGPAWRMPYWGKFNDLFFACDWIWTDDFNDTGVAGQIGISKENGNTIFFPAAGSLGDSESVVSALGTCNYWSSSLSSVWSDRAYGIYKSKYNLDDPNCLSIARIWGLSVRAIVAE